MKEGIKNNMPDFDGTINDNENYRLVTGRLQQGFEKLAWQLNDLGLDALPLMPEILQLAKQGDSPFEVEQILLFEQDKLLIKLHFDNYNSTLILTGIDASMEGISKSFDKTTTAETCYIKLKETAKNNSYKHLNNNNMNTQNSEFLKKSLLNLGFGDKLNIALDKEIAAQTPEFILTAQQEFNQKTIDYKLHFKAGDNQEIYFFNKYDASIAHKDESAKEINQSFYINKGSGITAKEAFNLMEGRAVHKQLYNLEGQKYQAWIQLDDKNLTENGNMKIKHYHENYGYDIDKVIAGKGIKELDEAKAKEDLMRSLKKGNAQSVTVDRNGAEQKYFIAANPQFKTINLYDYQMKKIKREELLQPEQKADKSLKQKEQPKEDAPVKKQSRKAKMKV